MSDSIKKDLRRELIARRDALTQAERGRYSGQIAERLFVSDMYQDAQVVLSYASFRSEVMTDAINRRILADGKELYLPKTYPDRQEMVFYRVTDYDADLAPGAMGIREPGESVQFSTIVQGTETAPADEMDGRPDRERTPVTRNLLILVPGVAFDSLGNRMGYGGGYYDRFFADNPDARDRALFLAYEIQRADELPSEPTDVRIKQVLTESYFYVIL